jgi:hypothetical protein
VHEDAAEEIQMLRSRLQEAGLEVVIEPAPETADDVGEEGGTE